MALVRSKSINLTVSYDQIVIAALVATMVLLATFSLGVHRGRSLDSMSTGSAVVTEFIVESIPQANTDKAESQSIGQDQQNASAKPSEERVEAPAITGNFGVQVATYKHLSAAEREVEFLKSQGHEGAQVHPNGDYYQIIVVGFETKAQATKVVQQLRSRHSDCFVRKL
ncbi:MAG: SPOR domain-containing protein [Candidatus Omnitrophica bacterium]|nr:SPOR domain-containing protein [Candidatus Omnitrophota bacterium]